MSRLFFGVNGSQGSLNVVWLSHEVSFVSILSSMKLGLHFRLFIYEPQYIMVLPKHIPSTIPYRHVCREELHCSRAFFAVCQPAKHVTERRGRPFEITWWWWWCVCVCVCVCGGGGGGGGGGSKTYQ